MAKPRVRVIPIGFPEPLWIRILRVAAKTPGVRSGASMVREYCERGVEKDEQAIAAARQLRRNRGAT